MLRRFLPPLLVVLAAWAAVHPALDGDFLYDDHHYVVANPAVHGDAPVWTSPLGEPWQGLWRPLTVATWRLQWTGDPGPLRLGNVVLHALAALLVLGLARDLRLPRGGAFLAALLFAVHPVHAEAVAWITGRAELLATVLVLLGWRLHLRPGRVPAILAALTLAAAVLAKENAAVAPALLLVADLGLGRRRAPGHAGESDIRPVPWARTALLAAAVGGAFALRLAVLPDALPARGPYVDLPLSARAVVALDVLARGLRLLVFPAPLRIEYQRDEFLALSGASLAILSATLVLGVLAWRRVRVAAVGLALVPVALATVLHLVPIGEPFAERFLYLPSVPFCLAVGALLAAWGRIERRRDGLGPSLLVSVLVILAALPASRAACAAFRSEVTLWTQAVRAAPHVALARYNLGLALEAAGRRHTEDRDRPGSSAELAASLALQPRHAYAPWAHLLLGHHALQNAAGRRPQPVAAARHYRAALELEPGLFDPRLHLARIALLAPQLVSPDEARALLAPFTDVDATHLDAVSALALQDVLRQLPEPTSSTESTGTSSDDGS